MWYIDVKDIFFIDNNLDDCPYSQIAPTIENSMLLRQR